MAVDGKLVEKMFVEFTSFLASANRMETHDLEALVERFRVELIISKPSRERKDLFRSYIDMFEAELERRYEKRDEDPDSIQDQVKRYLKKLIPTLMEENKDT